MESQEPTESVNPDRNLVTLLQYVATSSSQSIIAYQAGHAPEDSVPTAVSYSDLLYMAHANAQLLQRLCPLPEKNAEERRVVLLCLDNILDSIVWFWSAVIAGILPAISTASILEPDRSDYLSHLRILLKDPLCIVHRSLSGANGSRDFAARLPVERTTSQSLAAMSRSMSPLPLSSHSSRFDPAVLMLTSGTTGKAKAVQLSHGQILASLAGKAKSGRSHGDGPCLNWIGMDHVACLTEIHLFAMYMGLSQVHLPAEEVLSSPVQLLNMVSRHRASRTFAPHSFLAKLSRELESEQTSSLGGDLDLRCLRWLGSGGEANMVDVCERLQTQLEKYSACKDIIVPGFGMTETCAGCIYNTNCPTYDRDQNHQHASAGESISGLQFRVRLRDGKSSSEFANTGQVGLLELSGDVVFDRYYNDRESTVASFTDDDWFTTGDLACVNQDGQVSLQGRSKDTMIINGAKYSPNELERHLERELIEGAVPNSFCCFSTLAQSSDTEQIVVAYLPSIEEDDTRIQTKTRNRIVDVVGIHTSSSAIVLPLKAMDLKPSAFGKLPRGAIKTAFENGAYNQELRKASEAYAVDHDVAGGTTSPLEVLVCRVVQEHFDVVKEPHVGVQTSILLLGATSMDLIKIGRLISNRLQLCERLTLSQILRNPTPRRLAAVIEGFGKKDGAGSLVVTLRSDGRQTPLWLVHPGVGEILVFMNIVRLIDDRRVYAFRAEGLDSGVSPFASLDELLDCYFNHLKAVQPTGPYAIAGYSFGSMIAFELCKRLEAAGNVVIYCGCWNLPPHIKHRMRQLGWVECLANLFHFTELMGQGQAMHQIPLLRQIPKQEAVAHLRALSDSARWVELGLSEDEYVRWADLASSLQRLAQDYEPRGRVRSMDVFVADPLKEVAVDREDWVKNKLSRWREFADDVQFHDVPGEHYSMLDEINVSQFARKLKDILEAREGRIRHVSSAAPRFGPAHNT
ncbi:hypothetical protein BDP81DRAFT_330119 [Colletotrichum phormii]|uniref:Carrier domain-containing protein n=1 Tax=Colletotrichum phormii TaxID=359342 RepID=A0AAI9ZH35_9PEZI|nr:uncharacterized protein BDP81DRAFT_330119 [Colletotrichum phormii]KAK1624473.1 hypothetical protein BDP81DRAFT_330119 [Colletotrichum phormii]